MRVAYGWTKAVWMEIEVRGACSSGSRRGCVEGDERVVLYRDRIGVAYQAVLWKKKESEGQAQGQARRLVWGGSENRKVHLPLACPLPVTLPGGVERSEELRAGLRAMLGEQAPEPRPERTGTPAPQRTAGAPRLRRASLWSRFRYSYGYHHL